MTLTNTIALWTAIFVSFAALVAFPGAFVFAAIFGIIAVPLWIVVSNWTWGNTLNAWGPPLAFEALRRFINRERVL